MKNQSDYQFLYFINYNFSNHIIIFGFHFGLQCVGMTKLLIFCLGIYPEKLDIISSLRNKFIQADVRLFHGNLYQLQKYLSMKFQQMNQTYAFKNKPLLPPKNINFYPHTNSDTDEDKPCFQTIPYFDMNQSYNRLSQKVKRYSSNTRVFRSKVRKMYSSPVYQSKDQSVSKQKLKENQQKYCNEQVDEENNILDFPSNTNQEVKMNNPSIYSKLKQSTSTQSQDTNFGKKNQKELPKFVKNKLNNNSAISIKQKQQCIKNNKVSNKVMNSKQNNQSKNPQIKDFTILKKLGQGKFGKVFLVKQNYNNVILAMKVIDKRKILGSGLLNQFIRELKIQTFLQHPNIIKVYGFFDDLDTFYILLQAGCTHLYSLMENKDNFTQQQTSFIIRNILQGINFIHQQNILHRDIKPENIIIIHGNIKLCDFGWAVNRKGKNQLRNTFCGTPLYLSPELLLGQKYDEKVDLWAIGVLAYQLHLGGSPFKIQSQQELQRIITSTIVYPKRAISRQFKQFVQGILKKNPRQRKSGQQLLHSNFITNYRQLQTCERLCI